MSKGSFGWTPGYFLSVGHGGDGFVGFGLGGGDDVGRRWVGRDDDGRAGRR